MTINRRLRVKDVAQVPVEGADLLREKIQFHRAADVRAE